MQSFAPSRIKCRNRIDLTTSGISFRILVKDWALYSAKGKPLFFSALLDCFALQWTMIIDYF